MTGLGTISPKVLNVQVAAFFSFRDNELRMFRFYVGKWKKIPCRCPFFFGLLFDLKKIRNQTRVPTILAYGKGLYQMMILCPKKIVSYGARKNSWSSQ